MRRVERKGGGVCFAFALSFFSVAPLNARFFSWDCLTVNCCQRAWGTGGLGVDTGVRGGGVRAQRRGVRASCAGQGGARRGGARWPGESQKVVGWGLGGAWGRRSGRRWLAGGEGGSGGDQGAQGRGGQTEAGRGDGQTECAQGVRPQRDSAPSLSCVCHGGCVGRVRLRIFFCGLFPWLSTLSQLITPPLRPSVPHRTVHLPPPPTSNACAQGAPIEAAVVCGRERERAARARSRAHALAAPHWLPTATPLPPMLPLCRRQRWQLCMLSLLAGAGGWRVAARPSVGSVCLCFAATPRFARVRAPCLRRSRPSSTLDVGGRGWPLHLSSQRRGRGVEEGAGEAVGGGASAWLLRAAT